MSATNTAVNSGAAGVKGVATSIGIGVKGTSTSGTGVEAISTSGSGLYAWSTNAEGGVLRLDPRPRFVCPVRGLEWRVRQILTRRTGASGVYGEERQRRRIWRCGSFFQFWHGALLGDNTNSAGWAGYFTGRLYAASAFKPAAAVWSDSSDARLKKDVKALDGVLDRLLKLRGVTFAWIEPQKHGDRVGPQVGMIAQEVEQVFPDWVGTDADGYKTLTFRGFEALTVEGMRTLHNDNLSLHRENEALRHQVGDLEDRMKKVEANRPELVAGYGSHGFAALGGVALGLAAFFTSKRRLPPSSVS